MSRTTKQPKTGGKAVDSHCQNHGICPTCISNRTISSQRQESKAVLALREYLRATPAAELAADWQAVEVLNIQGPTLDEILAITHNHPPVTPNSMLTSTKAEEYATDWAEERYHNTSGKLDELDLSQGWLAGYYAARRHGEDEDEQLQLAKQQLIVARKALHAISTWNQQLDDDVVLHNSGRTIWRSCVTTALDAIRDMRNLKRK